MGDERRIRMEFTSAVPGRSKSILIENLNSYSFDRSVLTPAAAFRFTAGSVEKAIRMQVRSADLVRLYATSPDNKKTLVATGFVDETDTHITANALEYVLTGRDTVGQLVDNDAVDAANQIIFFEQANLDTVMALVLQNTRLAQTYGSKQLDKNIRLALATSPGETKISVLQRYLEFINGLVWAANDGTLIVDKPDFTQRPAGHLILKSSDPRANNIMECRVRRNINQAIRQIVTQLNGTEGASATTAAQTLQNTERTFAQYAGTKVGRSVSKTFSYAGGTDVLNQGRGVGNGSYGPVSLGAAYSARDVARENMKILDVEAIVEGHFNENGILYNVDQVYETVIEDEDVAEPLYVYNVNYELTPDHGLITRMRLCRKWTICAYADALARVVK